MNKTAKPSGSGTEASEIQQALSVMRPTLRRVLAFGLLTNLLVLMPTLYMLEVYGRVVDSRNSMTLLMLTIIVVAGYVVLEVLEWVRSSLLQAGALKLESSLAPRLFDASFKCALKKQASGVPNVLGDLATLRSFLASPAMLGLLDAPFALMFIILIYLINPWLGVFAVMGALVLVAVGVATERGTRQPLANANRSSQEANHFAKGVLRNAQAVEAMGMVDDLHALWLTRQRKFLVEQALASDHAGVGSSGSKLIQTLQGSLLLGLGCWLSLQGELDRSGSMMIVGSILGGRALAPMAMVIAQWRTVVQARASYARLDRFLEQFPQAPQAMPLPAPRGNLQIEGLSVMAPGTQSILLRGVQAKLLPGEVMAIIGPSGAGKTTLARVMIGLWPATTGKVRLDGVDVYSWDKTNLGPNVGYLSQAVELFDGSLAQNIARFGEVDMPLVQTAAMQVGLHEHIMALPQGYETQVGVGGAVLSGGQRQRVGLARALYGDPQFLVLDEPNSGLDEEGEAALMAMLDRLKARQATVVVITHRRQLLLAAEKLMIIRDGQMQAFGPRNEVLDAIKRAVEAAQQAKSQAPLGAPQGGAS